MFDVESGRIRKYEREDMISILLIKQIAVLFLIMLMGFAMVKAGFLKSAESKTISTIMLYLIMPCIIVNAFQISYTEEIKIGLIFAFVLAFVINLLLILMTGVWGRIFRLDVVEKASIIYPNAGNLIIPIVTSVLGPEWVIYSSAFLSVQCVLLWSHGKSLLCGDKRPDVKKILLNINMMAVFLGIFLFATGLELPEICARSIDSVSGMVGPAAMIVSGMLLADLKFETIRKYKRVYLVIALRMVVTPLVIVLLMKFSGLAGLVYNGETIILISLLATMTPSATSITQMALVYGKNAEYANLINALTMLVCIITMPVMVFIYQC